MLEMVPIELEMVLRIPKCISVSAKEMKVKTDLRAGSARSAPNTPSVKRSLSLRKRSSSRMSKARSVDDQISNQIEMKGRSRTNSPNFNDRKNSSSSIDTALPASN